MMKNTIELVEYSVDRINNIKDTDEYKAKKAKCLLSLLSLSLEQREKACSMSVKRKKTV
jgi:hypothetical protein